MKNVFAVFRHELVNVLRARWLLLYGLLFFVFTLTFSRFANDSVRATAGLLSLVLFIVPLVSILYSAIYWYNSEPFTAILLTQPLRRRTVYLATWAAVSAALAGCFALSTGSALAITGLLSGSSLLLLLSGSILSLIFVGLGLLLSCSITDRMKGIGLTFVVWLYFALLHDALVFAVVSALREYPIEVPSMILMAINPIDLARVSLLLSLNLAAMMGYTGRILQSFISDGTGALLTAGVLIFWIIGPVVYGARRFHRRDL
jgi:Cu-processing system permease protein